MGYCFPSGSLVDGHWKFDKCDGRATSDCRSCDFQGKRNKDCVEYCKTWTEAYRTVKEYDRTRNEED